MQGVKRMLSSRDFLERIAGRALAVSHATILRWVQRFVPEFEKRGNRYAVLAA
jgi:transposase-like protein